MKLQEVLSEATEDLVKKFEPLIDGYKRKDVAEELLKALEDGLKNKQIYNVDYNDVKSTIGYAYEKNAKPFGDEILKDLRDSLGEDGYFDFIRTHDFGHSFFYLHEVKKTVREYKALIAALKGKKAAAALKAAEQGLVLHELALEFWNLLKEVKPYIVKGRKPKPEDPNAFHNKLGSKEAQKVVREAIKKNIDPKLDEFEKQIEDWYQDQVDYWRDHVAAKNGTLVFHENDRPHEQMLAVLQHLWDYKFHRDYGKGTETFANLKERPEAKDWAKKKAKAYREAIENRFMEKNLRKLSQIVDLKGNLDDIEELPSKEVKVVSGSATIEAGLRFKFKDKSHFVVVNKIVTKRSSGGRWSDGKDFEQYPTTFHDVTFPNGSKMKMPSEEKMVKEFAK